MDEQRSEHRWFSQDPMDEILEKAKPAPSPEYEGTAAEHAVRIIQLVLADNGKAA